MADLRSAVEAMQPVVARESGQDDEMERADAEAEELPPVPHKAY